MKKIILAVFASVLIFSGVYAAGSKQYFTVEADAIIRAKPDKVVLSVGVITKGKSLSETKKRNSDIIKKAIEFCKNSGIQGKNIQSDYINISPEFRNYETYEIQFIINQNFNIILEDISKYDEILSGLLELGINQVHGIDFQVNDLKKYRNESRKLAVAAAKEKAAFLAQEAGIKLGNIININDFSSNWYPFGRFAGNRAANISQNMAQAGGAGGGDMPETLAPGMVSVRSSIILTYEINH